MFPHLFFHSIVLPHQWLMWCPWLQHSTGVAPLLEVSATEENWEHRVSKPPVPMDTATAQARDFSGWPGKHSLSITEPWPFSARKAPHLGEKKCQSNTVLHGTKFVVTHSPAKSSLSPVQRRSRGSEGCPACALLAAKGTGISNDQESKVKTKFPNTIWHWMPEHHQWSFPGFPYQAWRVCTNAASLCTAWQCPQDCLSPTTQLCWPSNQRLHSAHRGITCLKNHSLDTR